MKLKTPLLFLLLLMVSAAQAQQQQQQQRWDLQSAIDFALDNNIQVQQSELNRLQNEVNLKTARFSQLPTLNGTMSYNSRTGRSINPFNNEIINEAFQSQNMQLTSNLTLFNGFAIRNRIRQGELNLEASQYTLEDTRNNTTLNVITFFTNALLNDEQVKNAEFQLETTRLQLEQIQRQYDVGAVNQQNLLQIKQQVANDELNLIRARNGYRIAILNLQQAMQLPLSENFEIVKPEIPEPDPAADLESPAMIYSRALEQQPSVKAAKASENAARAGIKVAEANLYPTLSFVAGAGTNYSSLAPETIAVEGSENVLDTIPFGFVGGSGQPVFTLSPRPEESKKLTYLRQLDFNINTFVGLNLNIPILNGFSARNNVETARISQQQATLSMRNTENQLRQTIEQAYLDAIAAAQSYRATGNQVEALEESFRNVQKRLQVGLANSFEFNQINNDLNRARTDRIRSKYDYIFKVKILDFYQGKPLSF